MRYILLIIFCVAAGCLPEQTGEDELTLIWSHKNKMARPDLSVPNGFDISPMAISGALSPRKHTICMYADSRDYYVLFRQPPRLSMVKDYGFRIDGRTGEGYLPRKQEPNKFSLPKRLMSGGAESELKSKYGTKADKLEASIFKKIRRYLYDSKDNIRFERLSIIVGPELKNAQCQAWGFSKYVHGSGGQPIEGQFEIKYVGPELWEISGSGDLEHVKIIYGTVADKLEKMFYDEIVKSLERSKIGFDRIGINIEPDLKRARCWINGLSQYKIIKGKEVWGRIKGHIRINNIDRANWQITGSGDLGHIKIDIEIGI